MSVGTLLAIIVPLQIAALGASWNISHRLTWLKDHVENHDVWHKERIDRGADAK